MGEFLSFGRGLTGCSLGVAFLGALWFGTLFVLFLFLPFSLSFFLFPFRCLPDIFFSSSPLDREGEGYVGRLEVL